ncbi:MAG: MBL fold metallo-hydrolase [Planctomycetes bacterium]|nr:MBL fold metallo-hydrolase [Planctomycetota bacterium]MBM4058300.1 MBL fold metallo-hydrolase [Planctomycetota bacterium]
MSDHAPDTDPAAQGVRPPWHPGRDLTGRLLFLGTGTSVGVPLVGCGCDTCLRGGPRDVRTRTSILVGLPGGHLLVDTTPDLRSQLLREGIGKVDAVLYTHDHVDHVYGLDDVRPLCFHSGRPMRVLCEEPVEDRIRKAFDYAFSTVPPAGGGVPRLVFERIGTAAFEILGARVVPLRLAHGPFDVLGFRFGDVAYCTDTSGIPDATWPLLTGLNVLVLDCLRHTRHPTHLSLEEALAVADRVGAQRTLLTHLSHDLPHEATNARLPAGVELAYDGLELPLG